MEQLKQLIANSVNQLYDKKVEFELSRTDEKFGDFACNVALKLAKDVGKNPREIAEQIIEQINSDLVTKLEVAGPGFINLTLSDVTLLELSSQTVKEFNRSKSVVIETNNPNPFKAMHIGHAFNAILADTIANLIEHSGAHTYRVSYHGDVGAHVGRSMYSLLKFVGNKPEKLDEILPEERNSFMSKMYAEGSLAAKQNEKAKEEIEQLSKMSFTREDAVYAAVYEKIFNWSFEQIDENVKRLGNKKVERRFLESDAEQRGVKIVRDNTPKVFKESDGALVFEGSKYGSFDNAFVSSRGTGLYAARDLGLMQLKNEQYHPQKSYIVTAEEQKDYFKGVIAAAELCMPELKGVTVNISTGTVKLSTGKMSSRDGDVLEIAWLFDQIAEAIKVSDSKYDDKMVASALRYEFLKVRIGSDVIFDVEEAVSLKGNSGPYLQYSYARAKSILAKADTEDTSISSELQPGERSLLRKISEFSEVVEQATNELLPHHICTYLYELAQTFNRFYEGNRVIGDERQGLRLKLVDMYADKLKQGLELLGISAPEKM